MYRFILILNLLFISQQSICQNITQNNKKLFGITNNLGDTLIPFQYSSIEESPFYADKYNERSSPNTDPDKLYFIYSGKRVGLYSLKLKELIPPIYDRIDYLYDNGFRVEGYLVHNYGKVGFINPLGKEIAPCEFDIIQCTNYNSDYFKIMVGKKKDKWYSWRYGQWEQTVFEPIDYTIGYEFILGKNGYVRDYITYNEYDLATKNKLNTSINDPIELTNDYYTLFCYDSKCGVKNKKGEIIIEPTYDLIQFEAENKNHIRTSQAGILYRIDLVTKIRTIVVNNEY